MRRPPPTGPSPGPSPCWASARRWWRATWPTPMCWASTWGRSAAGWRCSTSRRGAHRAGPGGLSHGGGAGGGNLVRLSGPVLHSPGPAAPADSPAGGMEGAADLGRLLSHQAGRKVELVTPQRGAKADLIRMAQENARTECERLTTRRSGQPKSSPSWPSCWSCPGLPGGLSL